MNMNDNIYVLAKAGQSIRCWTESGTITAQLSGTDDWDIAKAARELIRHADYLVFGEDYRWYHACTPKRVMNNRWKRYIKAIKDVYQ